MSNRQLVAHRGWPRRYPENTLVGFEAAVAVGARWLECDVQLSQDGVPMVIHDPTLDRTAGRPGRVSTMVAAELAQVTVGEPARLGDGWDHVCLPTLAALAAALERWASTTLFVELKAESLQCFGQQPMVARVLDALGPALSQCVLVSFDAPAVAAARRAGAPAVGWVLPRWTPSVSHTLNELAPDYVFADHVVLPAGPLLPGPWRWAVYEITDARWARRWFYRGAHLIETMAVGELGYALADR